MESLKKNFAWPFLLAFPLTAFIAFWLRDELWSWDGYIIFWLAFFVCATMANELIRLVRLRSSQSEDSAPVALFMVIRRNLRRYGGMLIHFGAVLIFLGVAGKFFSLERDLTLTKDQAQTIGSYQLVFRGVSEIPVENAIHRAAKVEVLDLDGKRLQFLNPAKSFYPTQPQPLTEVGIRRGIRRFRDSPGFYQSPCGMGLDGFAHFYTRNCHLFPPPSRETCGQRNRPKGKIQGC